MYRIDIESNVKFSSAMLSTFWFCVYRFAGSLWE